MTALQSVAGQAMPRSDSAAVDLSQRELEIATLAARGLSNHDISRQVQVTIPTVKFHLGNVYRKLEIRGRANLRQYVLCR